MSRLLPLPMDVFKRIDDVLEKVGGVLPRVDDTLASVETTLVDVTGVLTEVRDLLTDLRDKLELLDRVPALADQLDEVHRVVLALGAIQGIDANGGSHKPSSKRSPRGKAPTKPEKPVAT